MCKATGLCVTLHVIVVGVVVVYSLCLISLPFSTEFNASNNFATIWVLYVLVCVHVCVWVRVCVIAQGLCLFGTYCC